MNNEPTTPMTNDLKTGGQTPTPRTDNEACYSQLSLTCDTANPPMVVTADFARTLERESDLRKFELDMLSERFNQQAKELTDSLAAHAEDRAMLETRLAELVRYRHGHLPTCAGMDIENMRCGCGYLDGTAYREWMTEKAALTAQLGATKTVAFQAQEAAKDLVAQLDAARREAEENRCAAKAHHEYGVQKAEVANQLSIGIAALRAELEAVKAERDTMDRKVYDAELERDDAKNQVTGITWSKMSAAWDRCIDRIPGLSRKVSLGALDELAEHLGIRPRNCLSDEYVLVLASERDAAMSPRCKSIVKADWCRVEAPCKNPAGPNGYCHMHSPDKTRRSTVAKVSDLQLIGDQQNEIKQLRTQLADWQQKHSDLEARLARCASHAPKLARLITDAIYATPMPCTESMMVKTITDVLAAHGRDASHIAP